jgi:hypothetical protein
MSGKSYCMHAEHLVNSAHASWEVFPDTLAVICDQDQSQTDNFDCCAIRQ